MIMIFSILFMSFVAPFIALKLYDIFEQHDWALIKKWTVKFFTFWTVFIILSFISVESFAFIAAPRGKIPFEFCEHKASSQFHREVWCYNREIFCMRIEDYVVIENCFLMPELEARERQKEQIRRIAAVEEYEKKQKNTKSKGE